VDARVSELRHFLDFAIDAAWQAGRFTLAHFQTGVAVDVKADASPVTVADRGAEQLLRGLIGRAFPEHGIVGEEYGDDGAGRSHRWVLDPIDGTKSFVRGVPLYGTLVALERDGVPVVGVAHFPGLGETIAAAQGLGCQWNGRAARVSAADALAVATIVYTDIAAVTRRLGARWDGLVRATQIQRGWGDCYGHCLVATGRADAMLDPAMHAWDCAALVPIVQEAGGRFSDWSDRVTVDGGDAVSSNGRLHGALLPFLADARP
jgi:histidinol-phosphatase